MFKNTKLLILSLLILFISSDYLNGKIKIKGGPKANNNSKLFDEHNFEKDGWVTNT